MTYAIRFDFPEAQTPLFCGETKGGLGFAPTLASAKLFEDVDVADRFLKNGYPGSATFGRVVQVKDGYPVEVPR